MMAEYFGKFSAWQITVKPGLKLHYQFDANTCLFPLYYFRRSSYLRKFTFFALIFHINIFKVSGLVIILNLH